MYFRVGIYYFLIGLHPEIEIAAVVFCLVGFFFSEVQEVFLFALFFPHCSPVGTSGHDRRHPGPLGTTTQTKSSSSSRRGDQKAPLFPERSRG